MKYLLTIISFILALQLNAQLSTSDNKLKLIILIKHTEDNLYFKPDIAENLTINNDQYVFGNRLFRGFYFRYELLFKYPLSDKVHLKSGMSGFKRLLHIDYERGYRTKDNKLIYGRKSAVKYLNFPFY
ncbi:MAG: hypothetical protein HY738_21730 [Bacteroidia bacterium]|nr:hypothetical protein [Bacteroidia bacterium]